MSEQTITYVGEPLARQFKDKIEANKKTIASEVERATSKEAALETAITAETERATEVEGILGERIVEEMSRATAVEANLQSEINTIHTAQNCVDIVATYSELLDLDTSILHDNDKVEVLADETHEGNVYVYRLSKQDGEEPEWTAVGSMFTVGDSWKQWSKDNGSSAIDEETSAFLGVDNVSTEERSYQIGNGNTVTADSRESGDRKETDISINIGSANTIEGEGFNLGKENKSTKFGITLGQRNEASAGSVTIGEKVSATDGSIAIGISSSDSSNLSVRARAGSTIIGTVGIYDYEADGGSVIIAGMPSTGVASDYATGGSMIFGSAVRATNGSMAIGAANTAEENTYIFGRGNNGYKGAFIIGRDNYSAGMDGIVFGRGNSVTNGINGGNIIDGYAMALGILNTGITGYSSAVGFNNHDVTNQSFAFGYDNVAQSHSVSLGFSNYTNNESFALGYSSHAENAAIAIGSNNTSYNGYGVLLGWNNSQPPAGPFSTYGHGILLGSGNTHFGQTANRLIEEAKTCTGNYIVDTGVIIYCEESLSWDNVSEDEFIGAMHRYFPDRPIKKISNSVCYWLAGGEYTTVDTDNHVIYYTGYSYSEMGGFSSEAEMLSFVGEMFPSYRTEYSELPKYDYHYMSYLISYLETEEGDWNIPVSDAVYMNTMSLIAGADNTSYGNNNIAIGVKHTVGSATQSDAADPHNDGFATAIGYNCRAVRNYDFAMGYKSTAEGGENIAINQSTAKGYNNLALYSSNIYGIRNTGIHDSVLRGTLDKHVVVYNYLRNSNVEIDGGYHTNPEDNGSVFMYNTFNFVKVKVNTPAGSDYYSNTWRNNTFSGVTLNDNNPHVVVGADDGVVENIITGLGGTGNGIRTPLGELTTQGYLSVDHVRSLDRNIMHNSNVVITSCEYFTGNVFRNAHINVPSSYQFNRNNVYDSCIRSRDTNPHTPDYSLFVEGNSVCGGSIIDIERDANNRPDMRISRNILMNSASLTVDNTKAFWNGQVPHDIVDNFLVDTSAHQSVACFSFGQIHTLNPYGSNSPVIDNCNSVYNFGDNQVYAAYNELIVGQQNIVRGCTNGCIIGCTNKVLHESDDIYSMDYEYSYDSGNQMLYLFGTDNEFKVRCDKSDSTARNMIIGNQNSITGAGLINAFIEGDKNILHESGRIPVPATENEIRSGTFERGTLLIAVGDVHVSKGYLYTFKYDSAYYFYYNGCIKESWSADGHPVQQIDEADFIAGVESKTLSENVAYSIINRTGAFFRIPTFDIAHDGAYLIAADELLGCTTDFTHDYAGQDLGIVGLRILGNGNDAEEMVYYSHILGNDNKVYNRLQYPIQGDFVQGMNNTVHDGSNIICMGSANTSSGHNSVAIGNQLVSDKWQTVIGKYNQSLPGPERFVSGDEEGDKALFIVGNGYGTTDNTNSYYGPTWADESTIHRSNAMVVYADGTVEAKRFVATDEPDLDTAPDYVGQEYLDTAQKKVYKALGTSSVTDWKEIASKEYVDSIVGDIESLLAAL